MKQYAITLLPGDGIGPEVVQVARQLLEQCAEQNGFQLRFEEALIGHAAIEATGSPLPDASLETCRRSDAVLMGAVGDPRYDNNPSAPVRPEQGLLKIRKELGLFANVRPIKVFPSMVGASSLKPEILEGADIVFFRELTSGIYFGSPRHRTEDGRAAVDTLYYHREEVARIARMAFEAAQSRSGRLCSVDKANVLESSRLWREVVKEVAEEYPDVALSHMFVDNAAMQLVRDPKQFDVVLTGNMFGDILSDEASQIAGSLGLLASASLGESIGLFEPVHGSAPDIAGQGIANPIATALSAALLLEYGLGEEAAAQSLVAAVAQCLEAGYRTTDIARADTPQNRVLGTAAMGRQIASQLAQKSLKTNATP